MLDPSTWLEACKQLRAGEKQRIQHDCGDGECLLIHRKPDGYSAWCHRCAESGWVPVEHMSVADRLAMLAQQEAAEALLSRQLTLPSPPVFDVSEWPLDLRVWLYAGGLMNTDIDDLGLYYHKQSNRVIIPVFEDGILIYWQARSQMKGRPKYLNPPVNRERIHGWFPAQHEASEVILTEDYLSAYRIHKATGIQTCCLFGVRVSDYLMTELLQRPMVTVWLDPDWGVPNCPGQRAASLLLAQLRAYGIRCRNIVTRADPKKLSNSEIMEAL